MNRRLLAAFAFFVLVALIITSSADAAPVKIVRVWTEFRLAKDFVRLGEVVSGQEKSGSTFVHRTQPDSRDGYYFTVRVDRARSLRSSAFTLRLSVIAPDSDTPRAFSFPIEPSKKRGVRLDLGLTGADWPYGDVQPLAWRVEVFDSSGARVADEKSFLWEKPPGANS